MNEKKWLKLLKENKAWCYIKSNRRKHDSGFGCFEVGYLTLGGDNKMKEKIILGEYSDHIWFYEIPNLDINMDLSLDGYTRIFSSPVILWWGSLGWVGSSVKLEILGNNNYSINIK